MAADTKMGSAQVPIEADLKPLEKGMGDAKKKLESGLSGIAKGLAPIVGGLFGVALLGKAAGAAKQFLGESAKMAAAEESSVAKLGASIEATGQSYADAKGKIDAYLDSELARTALDDGDGREAISRLTNATGDYDKALGLMAISQDLARAKGMDLTAASELVGKVYKGNTASLSRYGIMLDKGASSEEALAAMQAKFGGQAEAYAKTAEGSAKRRAITIGNLREEIGAKLLPVLAKGEELFNRFLGSATVQKGIDALIGGLGFLADKVNAVANAFELGMEEGGPVAAMLNIIGEVLGQPLPEGWIDLIWDLSGAFREVVDKAKGVGKGILDGFKGGGIAGGLKAMFQSLPDMAKLFDPIKKALLDAATKALTNIWLDFKAAHPEIAKPLQTIFEGATAEGGPNWGKMLGGMQDLGKLLFEKLSPLVEKALQSVWAKAQETWANISAMPLPFAPTLTVGGGIEAIGQAFENIKTSIATTWAGLTTALQPVIDILGNTFSPLIETLTSQFEPLKQAALAVWDQLKQFEPILVPLGAVIGGVLVTAFGLLVSAISGILSAALPALTGALNTLRGALEIIRGALQVVIGVFELLYNVIIGNSEGVTAAWERIKTGAETIWEGIKTVVVSTVQTMIGVVTGFVSGFVDSIVGFFSSLYDQLVGHSIVTDMVTQITGLFGKLGSAIEGIKGAIDNVKNWFGDMAAKVMAFKLPPDLKPGSPTPMEEGLRGIGDAVAALTTQWFNMAAGMGAGQAATIKNIGSAFKDMGKGVKELAGAIKELTTAQGMGGASSLGSFDITPWLDQLDRITSVAMTKIAEIIERIGYNKIHKLKLTAARLKEIVQAVLIDFSAMKETTLPNLDTWFGQLWDIFDRAATMVNRVRDRVGNNTLIKNMAEAAQSIAGVFAIIQVDLSLDTPGLFFMEKLTGFLANIEAGADFLIPEIRRLGEKWGGTVIDQAADLSQRLSGVFDILGVSSLFKELTTQDVADPEKTVTVPLMDVITQMMADLELAADAILPGLQTIQDKWGLVLEGVQATAQLLRDVFGGVGEAYKSALDFAAGDTLDLSALSDKLLSLNSATALVLQGVALPTLTAAPGLAATVGGATATPTAITVNIYGADGGLRGSYTEETNDARVVDIKLSEALGAA